jgi:hypothetical protein
VKLYGNVPEHGEVRYSPAICMGAKTAVINGQPEFAHVSTSYVERQNLTIGWVCAASPGSRTPFQERSRTTKPSLYVLQFCAHPSNLALHPGDGSGGFGPYLELGRNRKSAKLSGVKRFCYSLLLVAFLCQGCAVVHSYASRKDPPPCDNWVSPYRFLADGPIGPAICIP